MNSKRQQAVTFIDIHKSLLNQEISILKLMDNVLDSYNDKKISKKVMKETMKKNAKTWMGILYEKAKTENTLKGMGYELR